MTVHERWPMVFSYYNKLSASQKRTYLKSDAIPSIPLSSSDDLKPIIPALQSALLEQDRASAERLCRQIGKGITDALAIPPLRVRVLAARPTGSWGELHGLYEPAEGRASAVITLWMRTAKHRRVVAFRSFLRTLLHEICHHLDYELLLLEESFHTQGFYQRQSSLFHQLVEGENEKKEGL